MIVLLVISVLAISIGVSRSTDTTKKDSSEILGPETSPNTKADSALVEITREDGTNITTDTAFLLCKNRRLERFDPRTAQSVETWNLEVHNAVRIAQDLQSPNIFLAVAGSCFPNLDELVEAFRSSGFNLGYEPVPEDAQVPWQ
ncbi:hypothetical protein [Cyanobium sp. NIES-981]|uniref:hypothetical protein n=1 Tax=Cyanobium sp. NIES-981 TaxID=1851505 RepID=UPI0012FC8683|nr:hypothetical protein [Cyanobium sp. NIES-981]